MIKSLAKIFFAFIFIVSIASCEKKSCNNVVCPQGQACNSGKCYCADGYEGTDCQTLAYLKYVANNRSWYVTETCYSSLPNFPTYTAFFTQYSTNPSLIEINNFMGGNCSIDAYIRTDQSNLGDIIEIPTTSCGGITVSGQGNYDPANNRITFQLNYTTQNGSFQCTQTFY